MAFPSKCTNPKIFFLLGAFSLAVSDANNAYVFNCTEGRAFNEACETGCNLGFVACNQFGDNCRSGMQSICMSKCNIKAAEKCMDVMPDKSTSASSSGCENARRGANIEGVVWAVAISFMALAAIMLRLKYVGGAKANTRVMLWDDTNEMNRSTGYSLVEDQEVEESTTPVTGQDISGITSTSSNNIPSTVATRPTARDTTWSNVTSTINSSVTSERVDIDHVILMDGQEIGSCHN